MVLRICGGAGTRLRIRGGAGTRLRIRGRAGARLRIRGGAGTRLRIRGGAGARLRIRGGAGARLRIRGRAKEALRSRGSNDLKRSIRVAARFGIGRFGSDCLVDQHIAELALGPYYMAIFVSLDLVKRLIILCQYLVKRLLVGFR